MWISDVSIRRPVFATMAIMSFMVLGIVSMTRLGIDLFPEVNFPFINISVVYPGASPEEVETLVTRPIEDAVAGINGVKRVVSSSTESRALVGLELRLEIDPQAAAAEVREKVSAIRSRLPAQIEDPTIVRFDVAALPIMTFAVGSSQRSDVTRRQADGSLRMHYDPAIAVPFMAAKTDKDIELWNYYDAIRCPTLVIRGALSDLLRRETLEEMAGRGPRAKTVEIADVGHAPTLMHQDQIAIVRDFLLAD